MKTEIRIVYKVVSSNRKDECGVTSWSSYIANDYYATIWYRIGTKMFPKPKFVENGFLLVAFKTFNDAYRYSSYMPVLECEAEVVLDHKQPFLRIRSPFLTSKNGVVRYYVEMDEAGVKEAWPAGTVFCNWVIPKRVVDSGDF